MKRQNCKLLALGILCLGIIVSGCGHVWESITYSGGGSSQSYSWSFIDGAQPSTGLNYSSTWGAKSAQGTVLNGSFFMAFRQAINAGLNDNIRVIEYNGNSSWSFIDGDGATGINWNTSVFAAYPTVATFNNTVFVAWHEGGSPHHIQTALWNGGSGFTFADSSVNGINYNGAYDAQHPMCTTFNSNLYCGWQENNSSSITQIRIAEYASGTTWNFVDGNGANGLNYNTAQAAGDLSLVVYNSTLYALWTENNAGVYQLRVAKYNGGSSWSFVDGGGATGLNYNTANTVSYATGVSYNGQLVIFWDENNLVRAKAYNGSAWTSLDGGVGLNYNATNYAQPGFDLQATVWNGNLVMTWGEQYLGIPQIRAAQYNGSTWTFIDGNLATGLNYNSTYSTFYDSQVTAFGGGLLLTWGEQNSSGVYQLRAALYSN